jgi:hypothetical protein
MEVDIVEKNKEKFYEVFEREEKKNNILSIGGGKEKKGHTHANPVNAMDLDAMDKINHACKDILHKFGVK